MNSVGMMLGFNNLKKQFPPVFQLVNLRCLAFLSALLFSSLVHAEANTPEDKLHALLSAIVTYQGDFTQKVYDGDLNLLQSSSGQVYISRPDKFRWVYDLPYEQIIVSNGRKVWIYDADLEQVTIKPLSPAVGEMPAALLSGKSEMLNQQFGVSIEALRDQRTRYTLLAKDEDTSFDRIVLTYRGDVLEQMLLKDGLGQSTLLEFSSVQHNVKFDNALFSFAPPEGVDVIETDD